ncbi:MAG TPA: VUT family protein [Kofleriaceae bacterium]|nr:VUT family protein [Kofleriaceae bacterium]
MPTRQQEFPLREELAPTRLHGRREGTFLVLAGTFLIATAATVLLGGQALIDLTALVAAWTGQSLGVAATLPLGALAFPIGFVMIALVCDLYTPRRARALIVFGAIASLALVGLARIADLAAGHDTAFAFALAFTACYFVAFVAYIEIFDAARRKLRGRHLWLRANLAALIAQLGGWAAFGLVAYFYGTRVLGASYGAAVDQTTAIVIGASAYSTAFVLVATLPLVIAAHALSIFLRVGDDLGEVARAHDDDDDDIVDAAASEPVLLRPRQPRASGTRPPAVIVDDDPPVHPTRRRAPKNSIPPYSSAEMRFFTEGDQLEAGDSANDMSSSGVRARA